MSVMSAKGFIKKTATIAVSAAVFGGVAGGVFNLVSGDNIREHGTIESEDDRTASDTAAEEANDNKLNIDIAEQPSISSGMINVGSLDVSSIAKAAMPSVVAINVKVTTEYGGGIFGQTYEYETSGSGSGIIIGQNDEELLLVTNDHVVDGASEVNVTFIDGEEYSAKVKGTDGDNDLAVISVALADIKDETKKEITIAQMGDSDEIEVGEQVVAIGNALGVGQSVTTGIVSAKDRENSTNATPLIQTDAAINPGNSGGALLNMAGEVIGINSSKYSSTDVEGMGYAIPITAVEDIIDELSIRVTRDKVDESLVGYLGVKTVTVDETMAQYYNLPTGAYVKEVTKLSPASKAGIKKNSVIVKFDGQKITSADGLVELLEYYKTGEIIDVVCYELDDGEYVEKTYKVALGNRKISMDE